MIEAEDVPRDSTKRRSAFALRGNVGHQRAQDVGTRRRRSFDAKQEPVHRRQHVGIVVRGAPEHHAVHMAEFTLDRRPLGESAIQHDRQTREIALEAGRLIAGCRNGGITPDELAGGTFTVTNLGNLGVQGFTPVLNVPQVGILGIGAIVPGPLMAADGSVSFIPQIGLSLTVNHQVVDGAPGARFLQAVAEAIGQFDLLLAR